MFDLEVDSLGTSAGVPCCVDCIVSVWLHVVILVLAIPSTIHELLYVEVYFSFFGYLCTVSLAVRNHCSVIG